MGFWYFLILFIGVALLVAGGLKKGVSREVKLVIILFIFGSLLVLMSLFMFLPGSAEVVSQLLNMNE
ncbi:hypothetical protein LHA31_06285 [Carnobacterium viridans]|uniref:Uncharacterized protein n=1 Tax=Carnobacterium viridans TaxID=174587 RepID=A0A1H1AA17_9LACT|nr:hypothetical protein [Carnobacterium viridans]UDE94238.1 hypothetical protein LHA31_06285 [Carnobacterium viridans]SDQ36523.1 hypothetical protein SAMN04487752_1980 [Carnobacterium viridans]